MFDLIESDKYTIRISRSTNYLEYIIKPDVLFDAPDAKRAKEEITALRPDEKFYVYVEGIEFFTLTKKARELAATKKFSSNTLAVAFYTKHEIIVTLGEFYNKINKPAVPTKIFTNKKKAMEWLIKQGLKMKVQ
jgi:hypothetical protein